MIQKRPKNECIELNSSTPLKKSENTIIFKKKLRELFTHKQICNDIFTYHRF